ncbi:GNAT family N-acetyltransferase [Nocardioides panacisoli]|uniref:GNAT family N-acetyltransferase n=1 Tax=Nocardioides panacisoli TaxID=627624 RepID=UPI001C6388F4|nr:GNAT family N-acetyltransferase [Nocardioides panacisoli]QYJ03062.1 GNAT family N-acetyltransferase [Nocardioides panacisoli]
MSDSRVRVLDESDWRIYRDLRLEALRESPDSVVGSREAESDHDEAFWRDLLREEPRFVAERDGQAVGIVGLHPAPDDPDVAEVLGLWVAPTMRGSRIAWELVAAATDRARDQGRTQLFFWVASDSGAAVAFASTFGFRPTSQRRTAPATEAATPQEEVAMVLPLVDDPSATKTPWH